MIEKPLAGADIDLKSPSERSGRYRMPRGKDLALPSLPQVVTKLLEATLDNRSSMEEIARVAGRDPALTAQILRLANSPLFGVSRQISTLPEATVVLGLQAVRNIAISLSVYESFSDLTSAAGFSLATFWWHSLTTAAASRTLAELGKYESPDEAFLAGLLHDVGQLILVRQDPERYQKILQGAPEGRTVVSAERIAWGRDHGEVGADLLRYWRLQPFVCDAVRYHHLPESEIRTASFLVRVVFVADRLSHRLLHAEDQERTQLASLVSGLLEIEPPVLERLQQGLKEEVVRLADFLGIDCAAPEEAEVPIRVADNEERGRKELRGRVLDLSLLAGTLQAVVASGERGQLYQTFFQALAVLFDFESALLATPDNREDVLIGQQAYGSQRNNLAGQIRISCSPGSIWDEAFTQLRPVHYGGFSKGRSPRVIDRQIASFLGGPYVVIPLACQGKRMGALAVGISAADWEKAAGSLPLLQLLSQTMALALRGRHYHTRWARVHALNTTLLEAVPLGVLLAEEGGRLRYNNAGALRVLNLSLKETARVDFDIWRYLDPGGGLRDRILSSLEKESSVEIPSLKWADPSGEQRWLALRALRLPMAESGRYLLVLENVTAAQLLQRERTERAEWLRAELEKKTEELERAQERIVQAQRLSATEDLARKVTHEVNNPLGIIKNLIRVLQMRLDDADEQKATLSAIDHEIDRIAGILRQLSDFSGQQTGHEALAPGRLDRVLTDLLLLWREPLREKGVDLQVEVPKGLPSVALTDEGLKQLLMNLIKNAEEALTGEGRIRVQARLQTEGGPGQVVIEVADTGAGIGPGIRERLFDPFVSTKGGRHSGLGLSVCFGLAKGVGGHMRVKEERGWGAVFEVALPVAKADQPV